MKTITRIFFLTVFLLVFLSVNAKTIYYVKIEGTGDGTSWTNASGNIQTMIDKAVSGDEVWVAKGTYYPTKETIALDIRSRTFSLKDGVNTYGGFVGTESAISQRELADLDNNGKIDSCELVNTTLLSGDIDGVDDVWTKTFYSDGKTWVWTISGNEGNCYKVVSGGTFTATFDGFSVIGGNSKNENNTFNYCGGINAISVKINNCTVSNCLSGYSAGGIYAYNSPVTNCKVSNCSSTGSGAGISTNYSIIANCTVNDCSSAGGYGGGIYTYSSVADCTVSNCTSRYKGGGIFVNTFSNSINYIKNCKVSNCSAAGDGGGISTFNEIGYRCSNSITKCTVNNCYSAGDGGGIFSYSSVADCTVDKCTALNAGGGIGIYSGSTSSSSVTNCIVTNCSSRFYGGGINTHVSDYTSLCTFLISNCTVSSCTSNYGGGIYTQADNTTSSLTNCTVSNCTASIKAGGIYAYNSILNNCTVTNCSSLMDCGGIYAISSSLINCNVSNCSATHQGGGIYAYYNSSVINCSVNNCLAMGNDGGIYGDNSTITNCEVSNNKEINVTSNISGGIQSGNISPDIQVTFEKPTSFVGIATTDDQKAELLSSDWHLRKGSPCINAGSMNVSSSILQGKDIDGNPRMQNNNIDIGAYEYSMPVISMPVIENFDNWTDFNNSNVLYNSSTINGGQNIKWKIENQKAVFNRNNNLTTYIEPFLTLSIDATKENSVFLSYDIYYEAYAGSVTPLGTEKLNVEFSTDLLSWSPIATYSNALGTIPNKNYKHDISKLAAGKTFYIRFNANGENSNRIEKWEIDNVIINKEGETATIEVQANKYKYTINNGDLIIRNSGQVELIHLYDINGKLIESKNVLSETTHFLLPTHGVYVIKVFSVSGVENKKVVW